MDEPGEEKEELPDGIKEEEGEGREDPVLSEHHYLE